MINKDCANFSADLRRIAYWIYEKRFNLAKKMLGKCKLLYREISPKVGCYENIWDEIKKIEKLEGGKNKAAERASTASVILLNNSTLI